jgi:predicted ATPase
MAKLTVKNVGPIREAELEVKKHTIFIGPQGSGKSTLAKLIAILSTKKNDNYTQDTFSEYNLHNYISKSSDAEFITNRYSASFKDLNLNYILLNEEGKTITQSVVFHDKESKPSSSSDETIDLEEMANILSNKEGIDMDEVLNNMLNKFKSATNILWKPSDIINEEYIPSERILTPVLSDAIWSLISAEINLPRVIQLFGRDFEQARNTINKLSIPFLKLKYERRDGVDFIEHEAKGYIKLSESASGYQSIIPLLLVVEYHRQRSRRRFIIEEPELNLYPIAQKDLIYSLMSGLQPDVEYKDAEWVITTHSPYVLTSFNTLMLAYKVAQRSDELKEEVKKIVPERCWINPDEFAAYYVDNGTVESITNPETGLINDSRLDDVSEDFAGEQDKLLALYRTAFVND